MLVLERTFGEAILIGDDISIVINDINGHQVKFAIDAPKNIAIDRLEIRKRKIANPYLEKKNAID